MVERSLSREEAIEFSCSDCQAAIRSAPSSAGGQVKCPVCSKLVTVPNPTVEADGSHGDLPSLADLANSSLGNIDLPDELEANIAVLGANKGDGANELDNLVDGLLKDSEVKKEKEDPNATIKLDDDDGLGHEGVIGVKCSVCDTRIHAREEQVGTQVECPVCFTMITVVDRTTRQQHWGRGGMTAPKDRQNESEHRVDPTRPNPTMEAEIKPEVTIRNSGGGASALPSLEELELHPLDDGDEDEIPSLADLGKLQSPTSNSGVSSSEKSTDELQPSELLTGGGTLEASFHRPDAKPELGLGPASDDLLTPLLTDDSLAMDTGHGDLTDQESTNRLFDGDELALAPPEPVWSEETKEKKTKRRAKRRASPQADSKAKMSGSTPASVSTPALAQPSSRGKAGSKAAESEKPRQNAAASRPAKPGASPQGSLAAAKPEVKAKPTDANSESKRSRKDRLEEAKRKQQLDEDRAGQTYEIPVEEQDFPSFGDGSLMGAVSEMILSPGLIWRVAVAVVLMMAGAIGSEVWFPSGMAMKGMGIGEIAGRSVMAIGLGVLPYYLGLAALWIVAAYMFRDAALGHRTVDSWSIAGSSELFGTFLLFAFGYFFAGLIGVFFQPLVMPLRMMLGPLFLAAAFFNRSPWGIVAVDIFSNFNKLKNQWTTFYIWMVLLAAAGLIAGLLFYFRSYTDLLAVDAFLSVVGIAICVAITLVFAPVAGWHTGLIVKDLQEE